MPILQIEHKVQNFDGWKKVFDSDPINRKKSGVRRYRIFRLSDDPDHVVIDLEFDTLNEAEAVLTALRKLWSQVEGKVMFKPQARMLDVVEVKEN